MPRFGSWSATESLRRSAVHEIPTTADRRREWRARLHRPDRQHSEAPLVPSGERGPAADHEFRSTLRHAGRRASRPLTCPAEATIQCNSLTGIDGNERETYRGSRKWIFQFDPFFAIATGAPVGSRRSSVAPSHAALAARAACAPVQRRTASRDQRARRADRQSASLPAPSLNGRACHGTSALEADPSPVPATPPSSTRCRPP